MNKTHQRAYGTKENSSIFNENGKKWTVVQVVRSIRVLPGRLTIYHLFVWNYNFGKCWKCNGWRKVIQTSNNGLFNLTITAYYRFPSPFFHTHTHTHNKYAINNHQCQWWFFCSFLNVSATDTDSNTGHDEKRSEVGNGKSALDTRNLKSKIR